MTEHPLVLVRDLAHEVRQHRVSLLKDLKKRGCPLVEVRDPSTGNQKAKAISRTDADAYIAAREAEGFGRSIKKASSNEGFIYAVAPDPELRPSRIRVGWTTALDQRLSCYRAIAPDLRVLRIWPAKTQAIEVAALMAAERFGTRVGQELFDASSVDALLRGLDDLFAALGIERCQIVPPPARAATVVPLAKSKRL
jgi:hypothetical protein